MTIHREYYSKVQFGVTTIMYWPVQLLTVTEFQDGARVSSLPALPAFSMSIEDSNKAKGLAIMLGYGDDVRTMSLEHEVAHTVIRWCSHGSYSPVLWRVAHELPPLPDAGDEEALVLALQAWYRLDKYSERLDDIYIHLPTIRQMMDTVLSDLQNNIWYSSDDDLVIERGN